MSVPLKKLITQGNPEEVGDRYDEDSETSEKAGTRADKLSMWRMGKTQELLRSFRFVSIFGFSMILMASWETMLGCTFPPLLLLGHSQAYLEQDFRYRFDRWWDSRYDMDVPYCLGWLHLRQHLDG